MTKIMGHRGAKSECRENTMAAFQKAVELGAWGIETDVHMLFDGSMVMYHDTEIKEAKASIYKFDGSTVAAYVKDIVFFEEFLQWYSQTGRLLNIEIKDESGFCMPVGERTVELLKKYGMEDNCIISCFHHHILSGIKREHPEFQVGALYSKRNGKDMVSYCKEYGIDAVHPHYGDVDREFVEACHQAGVQVNVWTVNSTADLLRMRDIGVDVVMTDNIPLAKMMYGE